MITTYPYCIFPCLDVVLALHLLCYVVLIFIYEEGVDSVAYNLLGESGERQILAVQSVGVEIVDFDSILRASGQAGFRIVSNYSGQNRALKHPDFRKCWV